MPQIPLCQQAALHYAKTFGWKIFPADVVHKKSYLAAKHAPDGANWGMTNDPERLQKNFNHPSWRTKCGVGIPTGADNGIFDVEADTIKGHGVDGITALRKLENAHDATLPDTLMAESPSGSIHRIYNHPGNGLRVISRSLSGYEGIDIKGDGGMFVAPPSVRADGKYKWLNDKPIADAPQWLIDLVCEDEKSAEDADPFVQYGEHPYEPTTAAEVIAAFVAAENPDYDWDEWNRIGMSGFSGSPQAFEGFDLWSRKSGKYDKRATKDKWEKFSSSPPRRITVGTLFALATEADPDWRSDPEEPEEPVQKPKGNGAAGAPQRDRSPPVDLWDTFPPAPMPKGVLPKVIEDYAYEQGRLMGSDPVGLAMSALAVCATVIPDSIQLRVMRNGNWKESARLWIALVGGVSVIKSPIILEATRELRNIDKILSGQYASQLAEYLKLKGDEKKESDPPLHTRVRIEDTTIEAAGEIIRDSPDGVMMSRDEMSGFFGSMGKYSGKSGMSDRSFYLSTYNGGYYTTDRIKRGSQVIENLSLNLLGGIQPDRIREVADEGTDDGLIQRMIPALLRDSVLPKDEPLSKEALGFDILVRRLHDMTPDFFRNDLTFSNTAQQIQYARSARHQELRDIFKHISRQLTEHFGKYNGMFARLCIVWHCIESIKNSIIEESTAQRVATFMEQFMVPHAIAFYVNVLGLADNNDQMMAVASYILAHKPVRVTNREVQQSTRSMRKLERKDIESVFGQLEAVGWLTRLSPKRAGDPPHWMVNPQVHELFGERAKEELRSRERARRELTNIFAQARKENVSRQH